MIAYLRNEDRIWEIPEGESAVGRGTDCTLPLDATRYPEISRKHVRFTSTGGIVTFRDDNSANGTLKNGVRLSSGELHPGDTLELGSGGPVFEMWLGPVAKADITTRVQAIDPHAFAAAAAAPPAPVATAAPVAPVAPTPIAPIQTTPVQTGSLHIPPVHAVPTPKTGAISASRPVVEDSGVTRMAPPPTTGPVSRVQDGATRMMQASGTSNIAGPSNSPRTVLLNTSGTSSSATGSRKVTPRPLPDEDEPYIPPPLPAVQYSTREDNSFELGLEQKFANMQKLLIATLVVCVALVGLLLYQDRQIEQNKEAILALQSQASNSVGMLMPQLDQRMNTLNQRLDAIDPKMQKAEDHMAERMNHDLPILLDKYLNSRMGKMQGMTPPMAPPLVP